MRPALNELMTTIRELPAWQNLRMEAIKSGTSYYSYATSPEEVWARVYSQWSAATLDTEESRAAITASQAILRGAYQWSDEDMTKLGPLVENVLRERGLMR